jgi:hypothetical protein
VVIDYETCDTRALVEKNFQLTQICGKVLVGQGVNKLAGVVAAFNEIVDRMFLS